MSDDLTDLEMLKAEIAKEARSRIAKSLVAAVAVLVIGVASALWLYLKTLLPALGAVPTGAVVAFDLPKGCPAGWDPFQDAYGRVLLGAGHGKELTDRPYRISGGEEAVSLKQSQMPAHTHPFSGTSYAYPIGAQDSGQAYSPSLALGKGRVEPEHKNLRYTPEGEVGLSKGGDAHENMPPFIALFYCIKK